MAHDFCQVRKVDLERFTYAVTRRVQSTILKNLAVEPHAWYDHMGDVMVFELQSHIAGQRLPEIRHPSNWWQAVKERWAPKWFLGRWPVEHTVYDAKVLYPDVALPQQRHFVVFERINHNR